ERFGDAYAAEIVARAAARRLTPADALATVTALTARSIADSYARFGPPGGVGDVVVAGGGAQNPTLMAVLRATLPLGVALTAPEAFGLPAKAKEAVAFALLGYAGLHGCPGTVPACTGATRPAVLGAITPGANYRALLARVAATFHEEPCPPITTLQLSN